ncbi:MAG: ROK family protein [Elusimicrobiota bacterium]
METKKVLGIDIGGTKTKIGLVTQQYNIVDKQIIIYTQNPTPEEVFEKISSKIQYNKWMYDSCGISIAGSLEHSTDKLIFSPNLKWANIDLKKVAGRYIPKVKEFENDANASAWGIYCHEYGMKIKNFVCITLGAGVGGGIIVNGKIYRGAHGSAGELGHMTIDPSGEKCNCGNYGCLETFVGAKYLSKKIKKKLNKSLSPSELFKLAEKGDSVARKIFEEMGEKLGIACANIINILNPGAIVFTGGLTGAKRYYLEKLCKTVKIKLGKYYSDRTKILTSKMGEETGIIGAACLVLHPFHA